jgi:ribose/xylose/arabinose/galactoside ABC-type transport system permease subunit
MSVAPSATREREPAGRALATSRARIAQLWTRFGVGLVLVLPALFMAVSNSDFRNWENLVNVLQQASIIGVIAVGMTVVLITGGFDLSVGAVAAMAGVVAFMLFGDNPATITIILGLAGGLGAGVVAGVGNGLLIAKVKINPLIATLGTLSLLRGLILIMSDGKLVYAEGRAIDFSDVVQSKVLGIPVAGLVFLGAATIVSALLRLTTFGQSVYAIGGSERAAVLSGIAVDRVKMLTYALCGVLAAVAGLILASRTASALPNAAVNYELQAITAAVIGGARLGGGKGSVWGTVLGVLMLAVIANGLDLYGVSAFWQSAVTGVVLLVAVTLSTIVDRSERSAAS